MCDVLGCDKDAEYWDDMDNKLCYDCMIRDADETGRSESEYELIEDL